MFGHVLHDFLDCHVHCVLNNPLVNVPDDRLNHPERLKQLPPRVQHFLRKYILLPVHPQIRETFLSGVKYFCQVAETALFVKDFVGLRELLSVASLGTVSFENFTEPFNLI